MNLTEATMKALQGKKLNESVDEDLYIGDIEKEILDATQQILEKHGIKAVKYTNLEMTEAVKFNFDNSTFVVSVDELDMIDMQDLDESKSKKVEGNTEGYRAVEIVDASEPNTHYRTIMLNKKHSVDDFQNAMWEARERNKEEIDEFGNDLEVVLGDIDPSFDWFELEDDEEKLTI